MGHGKLKKFAENLTFSCLIQPEASEVLSPEGFVLKDHPLKGRWCEEVFHAQRPIIVEFGCGKGDYTIALAMRHPEYNYIGVDIKGARLWKGAKYATLNALPNVAFLRTRLEFIEAFFAPGEVSEIWLTFSDPQLKSPNKRLTCPLFLERYRKFLTPGGVLHLKTDSRLLHEYTKAVAEQNGLEILASSTDIYGSGRDELKSLRGPLTDMEALFTVQTFYERMFLGMGLLITYLAFRPCREGAYVSPDFDEAYWRGREGERRTFSHQ